MIIAMHESAVRIIVVYLTFKEVAHTNTPNSITLKSLPERCLASVKSIYELSKETYPDLFHYMGYQNYE